VEPAENTPLTHGELPCPNCGYQRRGLEFERPCPECGARGFDGDLIVSGLPGVEPESRRSGSIYRFADALFMLSLFGAPKIFGPMDRKRRWCSSEISGISGLLQRK